MFGKTYPNCVKNENINPIFHLDETGLTEGSLNI